MRRRKFKSEYKDLAALSRDIYTGLNNEPTFSVTLETGTAVTVVSNQLAGINSVIAFMPMTAEAAAENIYVQSADRGDSIFTITHTTAAAANRTFAYTVYG